MRLCSSFLLLLPLPRAARAQDDLNAIATGLVDGPNSAGVSLRKGKDPKPKRDEKCPSGKIEHPDGIFCGRGVDRQDCPSGYSCVIAPDDSFAVCCSDPVNPPTEEAEGVLCGAGTKFETWCELGEECCNNSCGICIPLGRGCIKKLCIEDIREVEAAQAAPTSSPVISRRSCDVDSDCRAYFRTCGIGGGKCDCVALLTDAPDPHCEPSLDSRCMCGECSTNPCDSQKSVCDAATKECRLELFMTAEAALLDEYNKNRELWDSSVSALYADGNYDYVLESRCEPADLCGETFSGVQYVEVRDFIAADYVIVSETHTHSVDSLPPTIDDLFNVIIAALHKGQYERIEIVYDKASGYPKYIDVTYPDGLGAGYTIHKLRTVAPGVPVEPPEVCGFGSEYERTCDWTEYCCNDSCGICAPIGGFCAALLCESPTFDKAAEKNRLQEARARWADAGLLDYSFMYQRTCFCLPEYLGPFAIEVSGGVVDSAYFANDAFAGAPEGKFDTIPEMFDRIEKAIDRPVYKLDVTYDTTYGFPTELFIDGESMIADDEIGYSVFSFIPIVDAK